MKNGNNWGGNFKILFLISRLNSSHTGEPEYNVKFSRNKCASFIFRHSADNCCTRLLFWPFFSTVSCAEQDWPKAGKPWEQKHSLTRQWPCSVRWKPKSHATHLCIPSWSHDLYSAPIPFKHEHLFGLQVKVFNTHGFIRGKLFYKIAGFAWVDFIMNQTTSDWIVALKLL